MTKTVEEAAREFMQTAPIEAISPYYEEDMVEMFKGGVKYALSQPLAQRLTAEEKERVRKMYIECELIEMDDSPNLPADRITEATAKIQVLESIFGKDFFKEERE